MREARTTSDLVMEEFNFTPVGRADFRIGVSRGGFWNEVVIGDAREYAGGGLR